MAGYNIDVKLEGAEEISKALSIKSRQLADKAEQQMLKMSALMVEGTAKEKSPIDKGALRSSITSKVEGSMGDRFARVGTNLEYAVYQEYGTGIYGKRGTPITPKRGRFLVFRTKSGEVVFAKQVAGSKPKKFMEAGVNYLKQNISKVIALGKKIFEQELFSF